MHTQGWSLPSSKRTKKTHLLHPTTKLLSNLCPTVFSLLLLFTKSGLQATGTHPSFLPASYGMYCTPNPYLNEVKQVFAENYTRDAVDLSAVHRDAAVLGLLERMGDKRNEMKRKYNGHIYHTSGREEIRGSQVHEILFYSPRRREMSNGFVAGKKTFVFTNVAYVSIRLTFGVHRVDCSQDTPRYTRFRRSVHT